MKSVLFSVLFFVFSNPAWALDKNTADVVVNVNGMVCSFCAQGIEKTFGGKEEVEKIDVDLKNKVVFLDLKDGKSIKDEEVKKVISAAGYTVESIVRKSSK